jgi:hypothetical protein
MIVAVLTSVIVLKLWPNSRELPVPNLIGHTLESAQQIAGRTGLEIKDPQYEYNNQYPSGQIYLMEPKEGGSVPKDQPFIYVWVSKGPKQIPVPDIVGLSSSDATSRIIDAGFSPGKTTQEYNETIPADRVIRQSPRGGNKLDPQKPVDIVISLGPKPDGITENRLDDESDTSTDNTQTTNNESRPHARQFTVNVDVSSNANEPQLVRIVVIDDYGESEQYKETHQPGDRFARSVKGFGKEIEVKVYVGDDLVQDQIY